MTGGWIPAPSARPSVIGALIESRAADALIVQTVGGRVADPATAVRIVPHPTGADCTCYLGHPDDPTADEEACAACDREFWANPVFIPLDDGDAA